MVLAFPDVDMPIAVEAAFGAVLTDPPAGWTFTALTSRLIDKPISKHVGRAASARQTDAGSCSFYLDNNDGALTPLRALSVYWPDIVLDLPMKIKINPTGSLTTWCEGYAAGWEPEFLPTTDGVKSVIRVTLAGVTRRLSQGDTPLKPALQRAILAAAPDAYWPLQDGSDANAASSGLSAGRPLQPVGAITFGTSFAPAGGTAAVDISGGGGLSGSTGIPAGAVASWEMECCVGWDTVPAAAGTGLGPSIIGVHTPGSAISEWGLKLFEGVDGLFYFATYYVDNTGLSSSGAILLDYVRAGEIYHVRTRILQSGADIAYRTYVNGATGGNSTISSVTVTAPTDVIPQPHNPFLAATVDRPTSLSQLAIWTPERSSPATYLAADGYAGETSGRRAERLCDEDGIPFASTGDLDATPAMGPQEDGTWLDALYACETAGLGFLREEGFGFHLVTQAARYNRAVDLTVNLATYRTKAGTAASVLAPTFDDSTYRTEWTVDRPNGGSATVSVAARAVYDDSATANLETDDQLVHATSWRVYRDSVEALRQPGTPLDLGANVGLIDDWLTVQPGTGRVLRTGMPAQHPLSEVDELVTGITETLGRRSWTASYDGERAEPYDVAVYGVDPGGVVSRYGAASTVLAEDLTNVETAADVDSNGEVWATTATHPTAFPFDVTIGGLVYSCTAITGTAPTYTLTLVRLATDKTHSTGDAVTVTDTGHYGL